MRTGAEDITDHPATDWNHRSSDPAWFPDGRQIAFSSNRAESADIWSVDVNAEWRPRAWTSDVRGDQQPTVGPDDTIVFVRQPTPVSDYDLYLVSTAFPEPHMVSDDLRDPTRPDFSPDGARLVVARDTGPTGASGKGLLTMSTDGTIDAPCRSSRCPTPRIPTGWHRWERVDPARVNRRRRCPRCPPPPAGAPPPLPRPDA